MRTRCNTCVLVEKLDISKRSAAKQVLPSIGFVVTASASEPAAKQQFVVGQQLQSCSCASSTHGQLSWGMAASPKQGAGNLLELSMHIMRTFQALFARQAIDSVKPSFLQKDQRGEIIRKKTSIYLILLFICKTGHHS